MKRFVSKNIFCFFKYRIHAILTVSFLFLVFFSSFNFAFAKVGARCNDSNPCSSGEICDLSTSKCIASTNTSTSSSCLPSQYTKSMVNGNATCLTRISNGGDCDRNTLDSIDKTCQSGYCNTENYKCEEDTNCNGMGKYKLTTGVPFFGMSQGECVNVDTGMDTFLTGLLKFILGSVGTITVIIIIVAGFMWAFSAGNKNTIIRAKKMITDAVIGLVLTLTCGLMLKVINPNLVNVAGLFTKIKPTRVNIMGIVDPGPGEKKKNPPASCTSIIDPSTKKYIQNQAPYNDIEYTDLKGGKTCTHVNKAGKTVNDTIGYAGCGPTSVAKVMKSLGVSIDPSSAAKYAETNGYVSCDAGTAHSYFRSIAEKNNLKYEEVRVADKDKIKEILKNGNPIIADMKGKAGDCTEFFASPAGGHYIVASCYDAANGTMLIDDPYNWDVPRTSAYFDDWYKCIKLDYLFYIHK